MKNISKNLKLIMILLFVLLSFQVFFSNKVDAVTITPEYLGNKLHEIRNKDGYRNGQKYVWNDAGYFSDYCHTTGWHANGFSNMGYQCYAYGQDLFDQLFQQCGSCHAYMSYDINNLCVGDVIRYNFGHTAVVQDIKGETVWITDANADFNGTVRWDHQTTKTYIANNYVNIAHADGNNVHSLSESTADTTIPKIDEVYVDTASMTGTEFKLYVKASDNVGVTQVRVVSWADSLGQEADQKWLSQTSKNSAGYYVFTIKASDHHNAVDTTYTNRIFAYDKAGNHSSGSNPTGYDFTKVPMNTKVITNLGDFDARITLKSDNNFVVGIDGIANGSNVSLKSKSSYKSQIWNFKKNSDNTYTITNTSTNLSLDIDGGNDNDGTNVQIWSKNTSNAQKFYIMSYNGGYRLVPKSTKNLRGIDDRGIKQANSNIYLYQPGTTTNRNQTWVLEKITKYMNITPSAYTTTVGQSSTLNVVVTPTDASKSVTWKSNNTSVATVSSSGVVTAKGVGTATITATTTDGTNISNTCTVTVKAATVKATSISLSSTSVSLKEGKTYKLTATVLPSNTTNKSVTWTSNNTSVATVSGGTITAKKAGTAVITVKTIDGSNLSKTCKVTVTEEKLPFNDVPTNSWFYEAVKYNYKNSIIKGYEDGTFKPGNNITRGQLVTILWRMENEPKVNTNIPFNDVNGGAYYANAIKWASNKKIVNGYDDGAFRPDNQITRQQLAVILCNYAKYKGKNVTANISINNYKDNGNVAGYATSSIKWAIKNGVMSGKDQGTKIDPTGTASRCECAAMIYNYCMKIK